MGVGWGFGGALEGAFGEEAYGSLTGFGVFRGLGGRAFFGLGGGALFAFRRGAFFGGVGVLEVLIDALGLGGDPGDVEGGRVPPEREGAAGAQDAEGLREEWAGFVQCQDWA